MPFICPECSSNSMRIKLNIELPPDNRSDEISAQVLRCIKCDFRGLGVYEESRRGALHSESVYHRGYYVSPKILNEIERTIKQCKQPRNSQCLCSAHNYFRKFDFNGRWSWLDDLSQNKIFEIKIAKKSK